MEANTNPPPGDSPADGDVADVRPESVPENPQPVRLQPTARLGVESPNCGTKERPKSWNQIGRQGEFKGHYAGDFEISSRTYGEIIANFNALGRQPIPVDLDHAIELSGGPAVAWITDLEVRGDQLWALFEWVNADVREQVLAGQWGYLSPAIIFQSVDPTTGKNVGARLTSVALTTQPFLRGMQPVAASDAQPDATTPAEAPEAPATTTHDAADAAVTTAPADPGTHEEAITMSDHYKVIALAAKLPAEAGADDIVGAIRTRDSRIKELERDLEHARGQVESYRLADEERRNSAALDFVDAYGITDAAQRADAIALFHMDEARVRRMAAAGMFGGTGVSSPYSRAATLTGRVAPRGGSVRSLAASPDLGRPRDELIDERARALMSAKPGLSYELACNEADKEFTRETQRQIAAVR